MIPRQSDETWRSLVKTIDAIRRNQQSGAHADDAYQRLHEEVHAIANIWRHTFRPEELEDIESDAILEIMNDARWAVLANHEFPFRYVVTIVRSRVVDVLRARTRENDTLQHLAHQASQAQKTIFAFEERCRDAWSLIDRLRPADRELILAKYREGRSIAELALERGTTYGAIATRTTRIMRRLQKHLNTTKN